MNSPESSIPFALPDITDAEIDAVAAVLRSGWITTGAVTRDFEDHFAKAVQAPHAVALNSCTAALHLSLEAMGVSQGDAVFLPTFTFAATGEVVRYLGAQPVLVDVDPRTANLDPVALRKAISDVLQEGRYRPAVIMPVHYSGAAADLGEVWEIAREFGLSVVEDAAHAFPASYQGRPIGWTPDDIVSTVCFSFYATKTITTGEGGMVVTRSEELAERIRVMSLHGLSKQAWNRYAGGTWKYDIVAPGYKYNLTDIASAMGRVQLARAQELADRRAWIAERYTAALQDISGLGLPDHSEGHAWHLYPIRVGDGTDERTRDDAIDRLKADGVGVSMHFIPLHLHSYYRETYGYTPDDFPVALEIYRRSLSLPIYSAMSDASVDRVVDAVRRMSREL